LSSARSNLRDSVAVASPREPHRNGGGTHPAHPEIAGSNESPDPPCLERYHGSQRTANSGRHSGGESRSGSAGATMSCEGQEQPGYRGQGAGGRLSRGTHLRPEAVARELPLLSAARGRGRPRDRGPPEGPGDITGCPDGTSGTDEKVALPTATSRTHFVRY